MNYAIDFFAGREWWFLPSFVVSQGIFCLICGLTNSNRVRLALGVVFFGLSLLLRDVAAADFWCINAACCGTFFLVLGNIYMQNISVIRKLSGIWIAALVAVYLVMVGMCFVVCDQPKFDFHNVYYSSIVLCVGAMLVGSILLIAIFSKIQHSNTFTMLIAFVGQNTLVIYLLHLKLKKYISKILHSFIAYNAESLLSATGYAVIVCLIGAVVSECVRRVWPAAFGKIISKPHHSA